MAIFINSPLFNAHMEDLKVGTSSDGRVMHYSVGAVIERAGRYLMLDRTKPPFGWAGVAGHVDNSDPSDITAIVREVKEESGLLVVDQPTLLYAEEVPWNDCSRGIKVHYWKLYRCDTIGTPRKDAESKTMEWKSSDQIRALQLEPVWAHWYTKLGILK